ncbi:hypothetical protein, partial [Mesorhizobium sp.]|uniref:hypothetical protein n=1 Tax=Mesorhizobium sp. TaxID=1871066 RepID=UPI0025B933C6
TRGGILCLRLARDKRRNGGDGEKRDCTHGISSLIVKVPWTICACLCLIIGMRRLWQSESFSPVELRRLHLGSYPADERCQPYRGPVNRRHGEKCPAREMKAAQNRKRLPGRELAIDLAMVLICANARPPRRVLCFQVSPASFPNSEELGSGALSIRLC